MKAFHLLLPVVTDPKQPWRFRAVDEMERRYALMKDAVFGTFAATIES